MSINKIAFLILLLVLPAGAPQAAAQPTSLAAPGESPQAAAPLPTGPGAAPVTLAAPVLLGFPVDCVLGETCWTVNYVDVDPADGKTADFTCGTKTTEAHNGTDFAVRSRVEMAAGVNVLAALPGTVLRVRDGEPDSPKTEDDYQAIRESKRECGNGILLEHEGGLQTFYCHLKQGSLLVKPGDTVLQGQPIAQIGQSGLSEFPHLHFNVIGGGAHLDPFTGISKDKGCGHFERNMWQDALRYEPYAVFDGGFQASVPDFESLAAGQPAVSTVPAGANALVFWAGFYHAQQGDQIYMSIVDPQGRLFKDRSLTLEQSRKRPTYVYTGRSVSEEKLLSGVYTGTLRITREGQAEHVQTFKVTVE